MQAIMDTEWSWAACKKAKRRVYGNWYWQRKEQTTLLMRKIMMMMVKMVMMMKAKVIRAPSSVSRIQMIQNSLLPGLRKLFGDDEDATRLDFRC